MPIDQQFNTINDKLQQLLKQQARLRKENERLRTELEVYKEKEDVYHQKIEDLAQQIGILKLGAFFSRNSASVKVCEFNRCAS